MRVRAVVSFVSTFGGRNYKANRGDVLEMPAGADWLSSGLVQVVAEDGETAVLPAARARSEAAEPVTAIAGIGPKTAEALAALGVETVAQLAAAEGLPDELARWQEAAREYLG